MTEKRMEERFRRQFTAVEARSKAQELAFAPFMFQAVRVMIKTGLLARIQEAGADGITFSELTEKSALSSYALRVLLEAAMACNVVDADKDRFRATKVGWFLLKDDLTKVNMDFTHGVCYQGLFHLDEAIEKGAPAGLRVLGDWPTIYEGLSKLPEGARADWLAFDHYYSDNAFGLALPIIFEHEPTRILDIGGNTGKFAIAAAGHDPKVRLTICDLPGQISLAGPNLEAAGVSDRVDTHPINLLEPEAPLPGGHDAAWMSQFLCCFSEDEIVSILKRVADALEDGGTAFILDTFWDRQAFEAAAYSLIATSLYFTCMANGNSRMYSLDAMAGCIERAGLEIVETRDNLGLGHTLLRCRVNKR